jgi:hypothetical protein
MRSLLLALTLLLPAIASATDVRGTLSTHTVWTRRGSPYLLKGDVTVAWGTRLTLEPGVQVIAASEDGLRSGVDPQRVELIIDGTLLVQGTRARPVEFTTQGDNGSWYGLRVRGGRGTVIDGAIISRAHQGLSLGMSAVVRNTSVSATSEDCLEVSWGKATLEGNRLDGCGLHLSTWARVSLREAPATSTVQQPVFAEARVRGRTVFSFRGGHAPQVAPHVASRPARTPDLLATGGGAVKVSALADPLVLAALPLLPHFTAAAPPPPPPRAVACFTKCSEPDKRPRHALPGRSHLRGTAGRRPPAGALRAGGRPPGHLPLLPPPDGRGGARADAHRRRKRRGHPAPRSS